MSLQDALILYGALIVAVILHEISHGVVALYYGDDTAKQAGRLTLNPIPHVDPVGSVLLPGMVILANTALTLTGASAGILPVLGWAKPVPVNPARLRNPRSNMLFVGLAGPFTNFALMLAAAYGARVLLGDGGLAFDILLNFAFVNLFLGIFNMLPIPPLDGSSLIERVLPERHLGAWYRFRPYGFLVIFAGFFWFDLFGKIIDPFGTQLAEFIVS
ncbi:MAG TPA: site-2 protease family protein [Acidimicrobiia bacterium]|nr:site-2 protease family protein [Acidimicrobiia bacterium]